MRLIDADKFIEKLQRMIDFCREDRMVSGLGALFQVGDAVMDCPTVDAVEVVRCKDCKHWFAIGLDNCGHVVGDCRELLVSAWETDFCSYGERKEGAD